MNRNSLEKQWCETSELSYKAWLEYIILYIFEKHYSVTDAKGKAVPIDIAFEDFMNEFKGS